MWGTSVASHPLARPQQVAWVTSLHPGRWRHPPLSAASSLGCPPRTPTTPTAVAPDCKPLGNPLDCDFFPEHSPVSPPSPAPSKWILRAGLSLEIKISATQNIGTTLLIDLGETPATRSYLTYFPSQHFTCLSLCPPVMGNFSLQSYRQLHLGR